MEREDERRADREGSEWKIVILRVAFVNAAGGLVRFGLSGVLVQREKGRKGDRDGGDGSNSSLVLRVKLLVNGNQGGRWAWDALTETRPCCTRQRDLVLSGPRCLHCSLLFCLSSGLTNLTKLPGFYDYEIRHNQPTAYPAVRLQPPRVGSSTKP